MTWSVCRLRSFSCSFTSRCQICDQTNIRWVPIENARISPEISPNFTAIQRILFQLQIWLREVKEQLKLHNLRNDHILILSELNYIIGAKFGGSLAEPWNGPVALVQPGNKTTGLYPLQVTNPRRHHGWNCYPGNDSNRTEPPIQTRTAHVVSGPVAHTIFDVPIGIQWLPSRLWMANTASAHFELVNSVTLAIVNSFYFTICAIAGLCLHIELVPCSDWWQKTWWHTIYIMPGLEVGSIPQCKSNRPDCVLFELCQVIGHFEPTLSEEHKTSNLIGNLWSLKLQIKTCSLGIYHNLLQRGV
jgi:hypothetical protein